MRRRTKIAVWALALAFCLACWFGVIRLGVYWLGSGSQ